MFRALPVRVLHRDVEAHAVKLLEDGAPVVAVGALEVALPTGRGVPLHAVAVEEPSATRSSEPSVVFDSVTTLVADDAVPVRRSGILVTLLFQTILPDIQK